MNKISFLILLMSVFSLHGVFKKDVKNGRINFLATNQDYSYQRELSKNGGLIYITKEGEMFAQMVNYSYYNSLWIQEKVSISLIKNKKENFEFLKIQDALKFFKYINKENNIAQPDVIIKRNDKSVSRLTSASIVCKLLAKTNDSTTKVVLKTGKLEGQFHIIAHEETQKFNYLGEEVSDADCSDDESDEFKE